MYFEFWTIEQDEVSSPQIESAGTKERRIEIARQTVNIARRIFCFMGWGGFFAIKGLW